jgi:hypothetical protein
MTHKGGLVWTAAALVAVLGCGKDDASAAHDIWFMGAVIDGAAGTPVLAYEVSAVYGSHTVKGKVDATTGRYVVGPIPAWNDYGILINADGYRTFTSYNAGIAPPAPPATALSSDIYKSATSQTFDFDAYLFPTSVTAPDVNVTVLETGGTPMPAGGSYRLQPTSLSAIQGQATEVGTQLWSNDNDIFAAATSGTFTAGTFKVMGGSLVYGVNYQVTVYGVMDFQPGTGTLQAGVNREVTVSVSPQTVPQLMLISRVPLTCTVSPSTTAASSAQIVFTFNEPIEDATTTAGGAAEVLDNGLLAYTTNSVFLKTSVSSALQERGGLLTITGNQLTIGWNPSAGLSTQISGDTVVELVYGSLGSIFIQPVAHPEQRVSLSQLLNFSSSITCLP